MILKAIIQTLMILGLACLMAWAGYRISRQKSHTWLICFSIAFTLVTLVILLHRIPTLSYAPLFLWLAGTANEFIVMALCVPFTFALLIPRLRFRRQKILLSLFASIITLYFVVPPFLDPAIVYAKMQDTDTWLEGDVCLQTTHYTCGAASAVTALKQLGIDAEEKEMAFASLTCRTWGASMYKLAKAIEMQYADEGLSCEIQAFDSINELVDRCPVVVIVKYRPMTDHYITVLNVESNFVIVGDPLKGKERLTHAEFLQKWRKIGIIVSRNHEVPNEI